MQNVKEELKELLSTYKGALIDLCYQVYLLIHNEEDAAVLFRYVLENFEDIDSDETKELQSFFGEQEKKNLKKQYGKIVYGILEKLLLSKKDVSCFYEELWKSINSEVLFEDDKIRTVAFYCVWIDPRIPYYQLDEGIKMSNEEYREIVEEIINVIKKARFILTAPISQRTERASLLVDLLNSMDDDRKKAVLMSQILNICSKISYAEDEKSEE